MTEKLQINKRYNILLFKDSSGKTNRAEIYLRKILKKKGILYKLILVDKTINRSDGDKT